MKNVFLLTLLCLTGCSIGPATYEKTVSPKGIVSIKKTFAGASILTKSKSLQTDIHPTGKISYRTTGNNETTVPSQFLTSEFLRNTIVPIAKR